MVSTARIKNLSNSKIFKKLFAVLVFIIVMWLYKNQRREVINNNPVSISMTEGEGCSYSLNDFNVILSALEQAIKYYESTTEKLVMDASVGTRVLEAQVALVLKTYSKVLPQNIVKRLTKLISRSESLSRSILSSFLANEDISSTEKLELSGWIKSSKLWQMPNIKDWRPISDMEQYFNENTEIKQENYFSDKFYGAVSDNCIFQLFSCESIPISKACQKYFFIKPASSYTLNHQILYIILAEQRRCHKNEKYVKAFKSVGGWGEFRKALCGKAWFLANVIENKRYTPRYRDLFTEHIAVCSLAGYSNFLKKEWLHRLLSWQAESGVGCFPHRDLDNRLRLTLLSDDDYVDVEYPSDPSEAHLRFPVHKLSTTEPNGAVYKNKSTENSMKHRRSKRTEKILDAENGEECLVHFTAMGIMVMSIHLRYYVETCTNLLLKEYVGNT